MARCVNRRVQCVVDYHEKGLINAYDQGEVQHIYPSYYPDSLDEVNWWRRMGLNLTKSSTELKISNPDQWIYGGNYYQYLVSEMGFPMLKIKALENVVGLENEMMGRMKCFKLVEDSFFDSLLYPLI
jgi:hypothetical protein